MTEIYVEQTLLSAEEQTLLSAEEQTPWLRPTSRQECLLYRGVRK
jgi:hypothetical protein